MKVELSATQKKILQQIIDWYMKPQTSYLTLGGFAGTGKTTLIAYLSEALRKNQPKLKVAFCAYTGKAARVLQQKLTGLDAVGKGDVVGTIHSLIYSPVMNLDNQIVGWERREREKFPAGLIIVDEASMVSKAIWQDLLSYQVPILAVGDHGQLPPIEAGFNLMENPQLKLEEIYRQEADNPIIQLSEMARKDGIIPFGTYSREVKKLSRAEMDTQEFLGELFTRYNQDMLVLVGYNHTRIKLNKAIRGLLEYQSEQPQVGDRVICLRNNHKQKIFNGMLGYLEDVELREDKSGKFYKAEVLFDGEDKSRSLDLSFEQFNEKLTLKDERREGIELFDFGYALTVHKAQGSQAARVVVFEERFPQMDDETWRRWLYTAVTRASEELYIVG